MLKGLFGITRKTTKADVVMAFAAAIVGAWKAYDTVRDFKDSNEKENQK